jgi:hypothetical protein
VMTSKWLDMLSHFFKIKISLPNSAKRDANLSKLISARKDLQKI